MIAQQIVTAKTSRRIVEDFVRNKLYPEHDLDFTIEIITQFTHKNTTWIYLDTTLPDEMLYRIEMGSDAKPVLTAYTKWEME